MIYNPLTPITHLHLIFPAKKNSSAGCFVTSGRCGDQGEAKEGRNQRVSGEKSMGLGQKSYEVLRNLYRTPNFIGG